MSRQSLVVLLTFVLLGSAVSAASAQWGYHPRYYGHYDPIYWGPGWGPYYSYDWRPQLRVKVRPEEPGDDAAIYIDGARAGVGDDFDGVDQGMGFSEGAHTVVVFLEGYRTQKFDVYLRQGETTKLRVELQPLGPGERSERPETMSATSGESGRRYR